MCISFDFFRMRSCPLSTLCDSFPCLEQIVGKHTLRGCLVHAIVQSSQRPRGIELEVMQWQAAEFHDVGREITLSCCSMSIWLQSGLDFKVEYMARDRVSGARNNNNDSQQPTPPQLARFRSSQHSRP